MTRTELELKTLPRNLEKTESAEAGKTSCQDQGEC